MIETEQAELPWKGGRARHGFIEPVFEMHIAHGVNPARIGDRQRLAEIVGAEVVLEIEIAGADAFVEAQPFFGNGAFSRKIGTTASAGTSRLAMARSMARARRTNGRAAGLSSPTFPLIPCDCRSAEEIDCDDCWTARHCKLCKATARPAQCGRPIAI
ncbi:hypothetical protein LPW26_19105 [Rhodopseudomonas sp. HC1]|uniref:hypothetical protein n=1 Tax=Rhodopseudomonas infernalis TaxID=2897386 RepID=UPI001EE8A6D4|nr:hypothetical protein [Rhodopseudomonas infernalis]MCG6206762.1 hypothetical protein [Rhodopseudomonas infernalis]